MEASQISISNECIGEGNGNPLQCSCLENPRDGGSWWAAVCGVTQSRTRLKRLSSSSSNECINERGTATEYYSATKKRVCTDTFRCSLKRGQVKDASHEDHILRASIYRKCPEQRNLSNIKAERKLVVMRSHCNEGQGCR